jgi:hypothetical protein
MGWLIGGGILYIVLLVVLGISCLRKGHVLWFILGLFLPFCWLIGALLPPSGASRG